MPMWPREKGRREPALQTAFTAIAGAGFREQSMDEIVKDFLIESNENLDRLDQELVKLA
jgi:hypothetical protein